MKARTFAFVLLLLGLLAPATMQAQFSSVCVRNTEKVQKVMSAYTDKDPGYRDAEFREMKVLAAQVVQPCTATDKSAEMLLEQTTASIQRYDQDCNNSKLIYQDESCRPAAAARIRNISFAGPFGGGGVTYRARYTSQEIRSIATWMGLFRSEVSKALNDPNYSADLGPIKGETTTNAPKTTAAVVQEAPDDPSCPKHNLEEINKEMAAIEEQLTRYNRQVPPDSMAVTPSLQAVMWATSKEAGLIKKYCNNPAFMERLASLNASYDSALKACRQINSSPETDCVPVLPDVTAFERQITQTQAPIAPTPVSNTSTPSTSNAGKSSSSKSACESSTGRGVCIAR